MWSPLTANVSRSCLPSQRFALKQASRNAFSTHKAAQRKPASSLLLMAGGGSALLYTLQGQPIRCDYTPSAARPYAEAHHPAYQGPGSSAAAARDTSLRVDSSVDIKSLSFGAVAGISTGIFIKKGLKAAGFLLGGAFVMLQVRSLLEDSVLADVLAVPLCTRNGRRGLARDGQQIRSLDG